MKVYLAGDMKSGWQDRLMRECTVPHEWLDPRSHGLESPWEYSKWDLDAIDACDVLVAHMHPGNPSGLGMSLEVGYAHGVGKPIIFWDEIGRDWRAKYFGMVRFVATFIVTDVGAAARELDQLL